MMKQVKLVLAIIMACLGLVWLAITYWSEPRPKKGYRMDDGRWNPHPKGSGQAANWSRNNPLVPETVEEELNETEENGKIEVPKTETSEG